MSGRGIVYLALSGGVDSSVAAALLVEQGYDVVPVFMKCFSDEGSFAFFGWGELALSEVEGARPESFGPELMAEALVEGCPWQKDQESAMAVCEKLGLLDKFQTWNFEPEFFEHVVQYFIEESKAGRTPNPDAECNRAIKFGVFRERALERGADFIATGHWARVRHSNGKTKLLMPRCNPKNDQTYFLWQLTQEQLKKTLFPIGEFKNKEAVRARARRLGLPAADRRSTRGICFVGKGRHGEILDHSLHSQPGPIVTTSGKIIGEHRGVARYTLGQRRGIGIRGGGPLYYVVDKNIETNTLVVAPPTEALAFLYPIGVIATRLNWISGKAPALPLRCSAYIRHPQSDGTLPCVIEKSATTPRGENGIIVRFEEKPYGPAPGQSIVFYDGQVVLGGGEIRQFLYD